MPGLSRFRTSLHLQSALQSFTNTRGRKSLDALGREPGWNNNIRYIPISLEWSLFYYEAVLLSKRAIPGRIAKWCVRKYILRRFARARLGSYHTTAYHVPLSYVCVLFLETLHWEAQRVKVGYVIARGWYGFHPREAMLSAFPRSSSIILWLLKKKKFFYEKKKEMIIFNRQLFLYYLSKVLREIIIAN